jgi:coenzyme F420-reducing hydrogenase delta subunit/ferredoxin
MTFEPKIVAFLCTWCSYTGADTAGISRLKSPANIRAIRVPCSGRVSPEIVMRTFDQGADGVIVLGCHIGECHYTNGNHRTAKRMPVLKSLMEFVGLEPERFRLDWVSASEGERYSRIVTEFSESVRSLGPVRWRVPEGRWYPQKALLHPRISAKEINTRVGERDGRVQALTAKLNSMSEQIQRTAEVLLYNDEVECVIGYEVSRREVTRPVFIHSAEDVRRLTWNQFCTHNLTTYLNDQLKSARFKEEKKRVALVVKPCDSRAINVMLAENRFSRDQVHIIGVVCTGINHAENGELQERCRVCLEKTPVVYDTLIGEEPVPETRFQKNTQLDELETLSTNERMEFWLSQFDRCIRCYACRQACPICDCSTCLYERDDSLWVGMKIGLNEKRTFHLGRAFHLAGRCIGCDECERVCPMNIPIGLLNRKLVQEIDREFGYQAGRAVVPPPLVTVLDEEEG